MRLHRDPILFRKVTIIGIGLLGGSIGLTIKKHRLAKEVVGVSRRPTALSYALKNKIVDKTTSNITQSLDNADLVILATPVKTIVTLLANIGKHLKRGCIVMDVGSTKSTIVEIAHKHLPPHVFFVGAHPLAGSEKKGIEFCSDQLFDNSLCILACNAKTNKQAEERVKKFWEQMGSTVKVTSPDEHDKILAFTSHIPHLLAYGLVDAIPDAFMPYGSTGLKDTTRIASSNPQLWNDIFMENSKNVLVALDDVVRVLSRYRQSIASRNEAVLTEDLKRSKNKRDAIN